MYLTGMVHEPSIHEQDLSVFAEELGNVCNQRNILNGRIPNQCIDMVICLQLRR